MNNQIRASQFRVVGWLISFAVLFLLVLTQVKAADYSEPREISGISIEGNLGLSRIILEMNETVLPSHFSLDDPMRIVLDFPAVHFVSGVEPKVAPESVSTSLRYGAFANNRSRLVIELKEPARIVKLIEISALGSQPGQLIIDLEATDIQTFRDHVAAPQYSRPHTQELVAGNQRAETIAKSADNPLPVVLIDPGHGGVDPGAVTSAGLQEKDVVLAYALALRDELLVQKNVEVIMTRETDIYLSLSERLKIVKKLTPDLFISIHADRLDDQNVHGATVYTLSEKASDRLSFQLANSENAVDKLVGGEVVYEENSEISAILAELQSRETRLFSHRFAAYAANDLASTADLAGNPLRSANFVVLRAPGVPSVLIEIGFLSNKGDVQRLTSDSGKHEFGASMSKAVDRFFSFRLAP